MQHPVYNGIAPPDTFNPTYGDTPNRFDISKPGDNAGWYYLGLSGSAPVCTYGDWRGDQKFTWRPGNNGSSGNGAGSNRRRRKSRPKAPRTGGKGDTAKKSAYILSGAKPNETHPYTDAKGVDISGLGFRQDKHGNLLVPMYDRGNKRNSLQMIAPDGKKIFLKGTEKKGRYFLIDGESEKLMFCEGLSTGLSIHRAPLPKDIGNPDTTSKSY